MEPETISPTESPPDSAKMDIEAGASGDCGEASSNKTQKLINLIILGMAGSGKTTFVQCLTKYLHSKGKTPYVINLDPACHQVPYPCNIDVRDTVKYKQVMKTYGLGPNGAIVTSLNLFATKFDQVVNLIEQKQGLFPYCIFDTPGQIEVFTWSASGAIITETLASQFPTVVVYVMDTVRSQNPTTFMSNMLYACSILYKSKLPFIVVLNKTDIVDCQFAKEWISDFEKFLIALEEESSYVNTLTRTLCLVLDEFYKNLSCVGVSSMTGAGLDEFINVVDEKEKEYEKDYKKEYERLKIEKEKRMKKDHEKQLEKVRKDVGAGDEVVMHPAMGQERVRLNDIVLNPGEDSDTSEEELEEEDEAAEKLEMQSFTKFLKSQK